MSLRTCLLHFKSFNMKKNHPFPFINLYFSPQYQLSTIAFGKLKNIQFPKHVQPLANQTIEQILSSLSINISETESVSILKMLRMSTLFKNLNSNDFINDKRFNIVCDTFENKCNMMHPNLLVSGLRSLLEVGVSPNSKCVVAAEESILKNIDAFSTFNLIGCLYFHHKFIETSLQKEVISLLKKELCQSASEIATTEEVLMLVQFLHIFNEDDQKILQEKIIQLIKLLNIREICKMFNYLAENSNRNVLILDALAFHIQEKSLVLQIKDIIDIFYSFKRLNFFPNHLISNLMDQVSKKISSVKQPSTISSILTICGHLRLRHNDVLNNCAKWIMHHKEVCRPKEFISFILTVAHLNYHSPEMQKVLHVVLPSITFEKIKSSDVWLDYVWSLAILNVFDKDMLLKVLTPGFYQPLIDNSGFEVATNKLKLMNLKAVLKNSYPECVFGCNLFLDPFEIPQSSEIQNNRKYVLKVLSNFIPGEKYLCSNQSTDMGIFIDAEFIMDKNMKPLPLSQFGILSKVANSKPLPEGAQRIALLVLFYKDFTLCSPSQTGINVLAMKLLFSQGYTVVPVPFAEFLMNNTEVKKAKYLLQKITSIMKKVEDSDYKLNN